ncbi:MAG: hypothetical protein Q9M15_04900 [Mariprofundaceae bacterium]|nr:hypothetical protein [Mariprofundaceae bacterium]
MGLSVHVLAYVQQACLDVGMDTFLNKRIEPKTLAVHTQTLLLGSAA